jgi:hypothetical protein
LKFKLDENLDVRLAATMHEKGLDGDTVLSEALSGESDESKAPMAFPGDAARRDECRSHRR